MSNTIQLKPGYEICKRCGGSGIWKGFQRQGQCFACIGEGQNEIQTDSVKARDLNAQIERTIETLEHYAQKDNARMVEAYSKKLADLRAALAKLR